MLSKGRGIWRLQGIYPTGKGYGFHGMFTKGRGILGVQGIYPTGKGY